MKIVRSLENRLPEVQAALLDVAKSGQYAEGKYCDRVRQLLRVFVPGEPTLFNSCGSALFTVFKYLHDRAGHTRVLVQNNTFYATGACAAEAGMSLTLVDSRSDCPSMSLESLIQAHRLSRATVVVLTHVGGWLAKDYFAITQYCRVNRLVLVEDCAHAMGVPEAGEYGQYSCWSFYPTKAVPSGEGGATTSQNPMFNEFAQDYSNYGKRVYDRVMTYTRGMNLRMSEWDAAVLSVQLQRLPDILKSRRGDAQALQSIAPCLLTGESNYYKYPVAVDAAQGLQRTGKVYARTDQLLTACLMYAPVVCVPLDNSQHWADSHVCLPVGEGLYTGMSTAEVRELLKA